jgi:hypothetical protein
MDDPEFQRLRAEIRSATPSAARLRAVWTEAIDRLGRERTSALWWSVFAATDASET